MRKEQPQQKYDQTRDRVNIKFVATLLDLSVRTVQWKIKNGDLPAEKCHSVGGNSGIAYTIRISDLPREAQLKYAAMMDRTDNGQADLAGYRERFGQEGIDKLMDRLDAVREMALFEETGTGSLVQKRAEVAKLLGVSPRTLYSYEQAYKKGGLQGIMDSTKRKDKGKFRQLCQLAQDYVHSESCLSTRPTNRAIYDRLKKVAEKAGQDACAACPYNEASLYRAQLMQQGGINRDERCHEDRKEGLIVPTHYGTVDRYIKQIPDGVKALGNRGVQYWKANYMPKALRAKPEKVNEVWFGDHHVFDVMVTGPDGRPVRPWLTAYMDAKSGVLLGPTLSLGPNSTTIMESLTRGMGHTRGNPFSGMPLALYIDNGKDYRCKRIEGNGLKDYSVGQLNLSFTEHNALLKSLGIGYLHATPYQAWSKTIERAFGTLERRWVQGILPGWCGHESAARPEQLNQDIRDGKLLSYEEFGAYFFNVMLPEYHAFRGEEAQSPMEIYESSEKARGNEVPSWALLQEAKAFRETRKVGTTGIKFDNRKFNHPDLAAYIGKWVTITFDNKDALSIGVLDGHQFICEAEEVERLRLVGEDPEKLTAHMRHQQQAYQTTRENLQLPRVRVKFINDMMVEQEDLETPYTLTTAIHERAHRERKAAKERAEKARGARTAAERKAESAIRDGLAQRGMELWLKAAEG